MPAFIGSDAIALGALTRGQLRWNYTSIHPNIYLGRDIPRTLAANTQAAALWSGGIVTGRAAAAIHGVIWVDPNSPVELIAPNRRPRPGVVIRNERIGNDEVTQAGGLAVVTPIRAALDLARHLPRAHALALLDSLAATTGLTPLSVLSLAARYPGARGVRRARAVVPLVDAGAQSPKETWLRLLIIDAGFPRPVTQIQVCDGYATAFIDLGWEGPKIGLEYDGDQHRSDRRQFVHDIGRHEMLARQGWLIVRVVKEHSPSYIIRRVHDAFRQRAA